MQVTILALGIGIAFATIAFSQMVIELSKFAARLAGCL